MVLHAPGDEGTNGLANALEGGHDGVPGHGCRVVEVEHEVGHGWGGAVRVDPVVDAGGGGGGERRGEELVRFPARVQCICEGSRGVLTGEAGMEQHG